MKIQRVMVLCGVLCLAACRVEINVPTSGQVVTESGAYHCNAGQSCTVEVSTIYFDETFIAEPNSGQLFSGWKKASRRFCGGSLEPCTLKTSGFVDYPDLMALLDSDEAFYLEPTFIKSDAIRRYQEGDVITFTGTSSEATPGQQPDVRQVTTRADILPGIYSNGDKAVFKLRTIVTDSTSGDESSANTHFWQEENGAFFDLNDQYGNYYWDAAYSAYGLASIPAPLQAGSTSTRRFYTLYPGHTSGPLSSGTRRVTVGQAESVTVPMGSYIAYPVEVSDSFRYLITYAGNKRDATIEIQRFLWVSQQKGVIKARIVRREYTSSGKLARTVTLDLEAAKASF